MSTKVDTYRVLRADPALAGANLGWRSTRSTKVDSYRVLRAVAALVGANLGWRSTASTRVDSYRVRVDRYRAAPGNACRSSSTSTRWFSE